MKVFLLYFSVVCAFDPRWTGFQDTSFATSTLGDLRLRMEGYFSDLSTILSDVQQLEALVLSFQRISEDENSAVFENTAVGDSNFHLKQNSFLKLEEIDPATTLYFTHEDGDCSGVQWHGLSTIQVEPRTTRRLFVPDTCLLRLNRITRSILLEEIGLFVKPRLKHSHQNSRRPEVIGLISKVVHNLAQQNFVETIHDFPTLFFKSYADPQVVFGYDSLDCLLSPYVIPQNFKFELSRPRGSSFDQDRLHLVLRKMSLEACGEATKPEIEITLGTFEPWSIQTPHDCELQIIQVTRTMELIPHSLSDRRVRYGVPPLQPKITPMLVSSGEILDPNNHIYVETLDDLGEFPFVGYREGYQVFRKDLSSKYIVPGDVGLVLHKAETSNSRDLLSLSYETVPDSCEIQFYLIDNQGATWAWDHGVFNRRSMEHMSIMVERDSLNGYYDAETAFGFVSSCPLKLVKLLRVVA